MNYSETELVSEIKNRNQAAYEALIHTYTKPIYYVAYTILNGIGSKEDIEECVSDVLFESWLKISEFDSERGSLKTWLLIQAKYKALSYKRRSQKIRIEPIEDYEPNEPDTVERQIIARETQKKIIDTINDFGETDRELFMRRYFCNEKISDLMNALEMSRSAIDNRLLRGRKKIKEVLACE